MKKLPFVLFVLGMTGILTIGSLQIGIAQAKFKKNFILDVACNGSTLALNPADPTAPPFARGDLAVVTGAIYPEGTLPSGVTTFDPSAPGGIGAWRCLFASLAEPPIIGAITYYFALEEDGQESMLMVQGLNSHQWPGSVPRVHAIVGGTGKYDGATGEVREEVLGVNGSSCFNLRFHFSLKKKPSK
jgi:hypothetical protein